MTSFIIISITNIINLAISRDTMINGLKIKVHLFVNLLSLGPLSKFLDRVAKKNDIFIYRKPIVSSVRNVFNDNENIC